jgi:hypothetical protein
MAVAAWWLAPALPLYLLLHVGAVWLVRSLYFYTGFLPALMDLGISTLSVAATAWAISRSGSVFLATWCFFLVQALFVAIPPTIRSRESRQLSDVVDNESFEIAKRQADRALRQLFSK